MKKWMFPITGLTATALLFASAPATLADTAQPLQIQLNNKTVNFPDAKPYVDENNRTMVPVRFIAEGMGARVEWFSVTNTVVILMNGRDIRLQVGEDKAIVNGVPSQLDTKSVMKNDRTYVPLRFVSENLGAKVDWNEATSTVLISYDDANSQTGNGQTQNPGSGETDSTKDQWGRKIRTTNLPSNAADYPYILEGVPNEMYEMKYPVNVPERAIVSRDLYKSEPEFTKENIDIWMGRVRETYDMLLNVDYTTIDDGWGERLFNLRSQGVNREYAIMENNNYANWVKKNKIQIEGKLEPEPSMMYYNGLGEYFVRSKFKFIIKNFQDNKDIFPDIYYNFHKLDKWYWYEGYVDIGLNTNVMGDWGSTLHVSTTSSLVNKSIIRRVE